MLDVRVTGALRHSGAGLSPFLLLSEDSGWMPLVLVTGLLAHKDNDWVWLLLFGGPFCELDNTPNFWLRNVKFWTWEISKSWRQAQVNIRDENSQQENVQTSVIYLDFQKDSNKIHC